MKIKMKTIMVAALLSTSTVAHAQSTVTLFGVLDEGINFTSNAGGQRAWQTSSVDAVTSRWGMKGNEDLGGGLHAIFDLESGFMLDNGSAYYNGRLFGYQSYAGLQSDTFGTVTFGRQFDSITDIIGPMTANGYWGGYLFSHPLDNDNTDATFHANNAVKFTSNEYGGFSATALYGFSNQAGAFAGNRMTSAGLKYSANGLSIGAVYEDVSNPGATSGGAAASDEAGFVAANQKIYGMGASYVMGPATLGLVYTHANVQQPASSPYLGSIGVNNTRLRFDNIEVNAKYDVLPDVSIMGMYTYTTAHLKQDGTDHAMHWNQLGVMGQYWLSKRTGLYTQVVYQKLSSGKSGTPIDTAFIPGAAGPSSNTHQMVARVGLTHSF
jgi:predicted porin